MDAIYRQHGGKIHRADGKNTDCNGSGQRRRPRLYELTDNEAEAAPDAAFCRKCFAHGKESALNYLAR